MDGETSVFKIRSFNSTAKFINNTFQVLIGLMELPNEIPPHFNSAYTPIAQAGKISNAIISNLPKFYNAVLICPLNYLLFSTM